MAARRLPTDRKFLHELDRDYLLCRTIRHAWVIEDIGKVKDVQHNFVDDWFESLSKVMPNSYVRRVKCWRCEAVKEDFFGSRRSMESAIRDGEEWRSFTRRYFYQNGYVWEDTGGAKQRPKSIDYTRELFRRYAKS